MKKTKDADRIKRRSEFRRLFNLAPGDKRIDRIRYCAKKLLLAETTIRIYLMEIPIPTRVPTELSLRVLADEIAKDRVAADASGGDA